MLPKPPSPSAGINNLGATLREAREKLDIDISEMAEKIKLTPTMLQCIENNDTDNLPIVYLRGYVRSYARELGIDSEPLLASLPNQDPDRVNFAARERDRQEKVNNRRSMVIIGITLAVFAVIMLAAQINQQFGITDLLFNTAQEYTAEDPQDVGDSASTDISAAGEVESEVMEQDSAFSVLPKWMDLGGQDPIVPEFATQSPPAETMESATSVSAEALELLLFGECWIEIKDASGLPLLTKMGSSGERIQLGGELPLSILLGDATVVKMWFAGEEIDLEPHTRGAIARLYLPLP